MIDYTKLKLAIRNLELQFANLQAKRGQEGVSDLDLEAVRESVIKRFDLALEMSWKLLFKYLNEELGIAEVPAGPKPLLRIADQNDLLAGRIEQWIQYVNVRNASAHDYSGEKAEQTLQVIPEYLQDAVSLYEKMSKHAWQ